MSAISGNVARERFDEVRHRNSCSRYPGENSSPPFPKVPPPLSILNLSLPCGGLREKGVDVREPAIPGPNFYRSTRDVIGNPGEHAASFYINPPPSSNDIHCWTALMVRLSAGLLKLSVARLILRITEEGTFSEVFRILCPFCVLARLKNYVYSITFVKRLDLFRSINVFNDENIF